MPLITAPQTGRIYALSVAQAGVYAAGVRAHGPEWGEGFLGELRPLPQRDATVENPATAEEWMPTYTPKRRVKSLEEEPQEEDTVTIPVVPEVGPDGVKRLYKTRYNELEKLYLRSVEAKKAARERSRRLTESHDKLEQDNLKYQQELDKLRVLSADAERLDRRISQLCKEAQIQMPAQPPYMRQSLEEKLDAFFGAVLCRLRTEDIVDELAD